MEDVEPGEAAPFVLAKVVANRETVRRVRRHLGLVLVGLPCLVDGLGEFDKFVIVRLYVLGTGIPVIRLDGR